MLVRLVRPSGGRRLNPRRGGPPPALAAAVCAAAALACAPDPGKGGEGVSLDWRLEPDPPAVGPSRLTLRLSDEHGEPLVGAQVRIEASMSHPGMRPVLADAVEKEAGRYLADIDFTMAGSWFILVSAELPGGGAFSGRIDLPRVHPASRGS